MRIFIGAIGSGTPPNSMSTLAQIATDLGIEVVTESEVAEAWDSRRVISDQWHHIVIFQRGDYEFISPMEREPRKTVDLPVPAITGPITFVSTTRALLRRLIVGESTPQVQWPYVCSFLKHQLRDHIERGGEESRKTWADMNLSILSALVIHDFVRPEKAWGPTIYRAEAQSEESIAFRHWLESFILPEVGST